MSFHNDLDSHVWYCQVYNSENVPERLPIGEVLFNVFEGNIECRVGKWIVIGIDTEHFTPFSAGRLQSILNILKCLIDLFVKVLIKIALLVPICLKTINSEANTIHLDWRIQ
jgi:hypothetical protein